GGTAVVVRGSGFAGEVVVRFGETPALRLDLISSSEIHAVAPPAPALGTVDVTVTVDGKSLSLAGGFEYTQPLPQIDLANPGRRGFTILGDGKRRVGESMALGDLTGDGAAELVVALTAEGLDGTWSVGVLHGGTRQSGVVELSQPSAG